MINNCYKNILTKIKVCLSAVRHSAKRFTQIYRALYGDGRKVTAVVSVIEFCR